jgi:hypothetical protein
MPSVAFKEWAVICRALADGRQVLILRKGGIAEAGGQFTPEHRCFWLYPTFVHQQRAGIEPEAYDLLDAAESDRPLPGTVRMTHFAEVHRVHYVEQLNRALLLDDLHIWSAATVRQRFQYRSPGLYVLPVRVFRAAEPIELRERPEYVGCRTWVELERDLPTVGATPVLDEATFVALLGTLDRRLTPIASV